MSHNYWLISVPGDKTCQETWERMNGLTSKKLKLCTNYKFVLPDLRVGTFDQLIVLFDNLGKLDSAAEDLTRRVAAYMADVLNDQKKAKIHDHLLANNLDLSLYLTRFQWSTDKYPLKDSVHKIAEIITQELNVMGHDLKNKSQIYNQLRAKISGIEKRKTGTLLTRDLAEIAKKEHFVLDADYLTTLIVAVPKALAREWQSKYDKLTDMVVPRCSTLIASDNDFHLYNVTLFKNVVEEFKNRARDKRFFVREFTYNENDLNAAKIEYSKLLAEKKKLHPPLVKWLKSCFSDCFCAWIHIKAMRVYVESVLRFGLPVNFQPILIKLNNKKNPSRLRDTLNHMYEHLLPPKARPHSQNVEEDVFVPGIGIERAEFRPYIFTAINIDVLGHSKRS